MQRLCYGCSYCFNSGSSHLGLVTVSILLAMLNHQTGRGVVLAENSVLANLFARPPTETNAATAKATPHPNVSLLQKQNGAPSIAPLPVAPATSAAQPLSSSVLVVAQPHHLRTTHKDMVHDSPAAVATSTAAPQPSPVTLDMYETEQPQSRSRTATPITINTAAQAAGQGLQRPVAPTLSTLRLPNTSTTTSVLVVSPLLLAANGTTSKATTGNSAATNAVSWNVSALNTLLSTPDEETMVSGAAASLIYGRGKRNQGKGRFRGMGDDGTKSGSRHWGRRMRNGDRGGSGNTGKGKGKGKGKGGIGDRHGKGKGMGHGGMGHGKGKGRDGMSDRKGKGRDEMGHGEMGRGKGGPGKGHGGKGGSGRHGMMMGNMMGKGKEGMGEIGNMRPRPSSASPSPSWAEPFMTLPTTYSSSTLLPTSFATELPTTATNTNEPTVSLFTLAPTLPQAETVAPTEWPETIPPNPAASSPSAVILTPVVQTSVPGTVPVSSGFTFTPTSPSLVILTPVTQTNVPGTIPGWPLTRPPATFTGTLLPTSFTTELPTSSTIGTDEPTGSFETDVPSCACTPE